MGRGDVRDQRRNQKWQEAQRKKQEERKRERSGNSMSGSYGGYGGSSNNKPNSGSSPFGFFDSLHSTVHISVTPDADSIAKKKKERAEKAQASLDRLFALPGMGHIRKQVDEIIALKKLTEKRAAIGLKCEGQSLHMVFKGPPGVGKTTAARLIGEAFILMGLLKSNTDSPPFIEVHLNDIESKYLGEAEENMKKAFQKARGGVLFMDEAYSFGGPYHHNKTFLANFVSMVEDMRDEVLVIMAGYGPEMEYFLDENPGIRSRFPSVIDFANYEIGHLLEIADMMAKDRDYEITGPYRTQLIKRLEGELKLPSFGNARTVRNILEQSIRMQASRLSAIDEPTKDQLMSLTAVDIDTTVKAPPQPEPQAQAPTQPKAKPNYGSIMQGFPGMNNIVGFITMSEKQKQPPFRFGEDENPFSFK